EVFVRTAIAAALIRAEARIVALNFVGPEDNFVARRDYTRHMQIIRLLANDVPVTLHAGELWLGLVPPPDLTFHIPAAPPPPPPPGAGGRRRRRPHGPWRLACLRTRHGGPHRRDARAAGGGRDQPPQQRLDPRRARQGPSAARLSRGRRAGRAVIGRCR